MSTDDLDVEDDLDENDFKIETIIIYVIVIIAACLVSFLIWAPIRLYITEAPCCVCDPNFQVTMENPPPDFLEYIKVNEGKVYSSYHPHKDSQILQPDEIVTCLSK